MTTSAPATEEGLLTIEQASEKYQVSETTIREWLKAGLPHLRLGPKKKLIRIRPSDIESRS